GYTASQFVASAAGEKLAVMLTVEFLKREAVAGRKTDFERFLASVPDHPPQAGDER
ncbi:MAG: toxin-antitoxin system HicB family antitoxin, partial [Candidatus Omnitrophica bacterium]|nr:toxin-antitoxin system HicB family antitoxin [Candidatus Omnitrophota bacterium]